MTASPPSSDALVHHARFLRGLAVALLRDEHAADDVVQETWLAALERPPRRGDDLGGWLATVTRRLAGRRRRGEGRRGRRERAAARPEAQPSAADALARESTLRRVTDAVLALSEPYRTTVLLRYYDGRDVRTIARDTGTPLATVKSRLQRGLAKLRRELDDVHGGNRREWSRGLVTLLASKEVGRGTGAVGATTGGLVVGMHAKVWIGVVAAVLAGLGGWRVLEGQRAPTANEHVAAKIVEAEGALPAVADASADTTVPPPQDDAGRARVEPQAETSTAFGTLDLHATRERTGEPAADVPFTFQVWSAPIGIREVRRSTDAEGNIHLEAVVPGRVTAYGIVNSHGRVDVAAGQNARIDVSIPAGLRVHGTVVDLEGVPVAGARLWVSDSSSEVGSFQIHHHARALTGGDGRFEIVDVGFWKSISAVAPGHAPSHLHGLSDYMEADAQPEVELVLQLNGSGGRFLGQVFHADGRFADGAMIVMRGEAPVPIRIRSGQVIEGTPTLYAETDAEGLFAIDGLPLGRATLLVRTLGTAPCRRVVHVQGAPPAPTAIHLEPEGIVEGLVRDADGELVSRAQVRQDVDPRLLPVPSIRTDEDGRFRLVGLATGNVRLEADQRGLGRAETTMTLTPGEPGVWDAVLSLGRVVRGQVLDHEDVPLVDWQVTVRGPDRAGRRFQERVVTGSDGGFRVIECPGERLSLEVRPGGDYSGPPLLVEQLEEDTHEIVLRILPEHRVTSGVRGRILDPQGRPVRARMNLRTVGARGAAGSSTDDDGHYEITGIPPGTYEPTVEPVDLPAFSLGLIELLPEEILDLGTTQVVPPGTVTIHVEGQDPDAPPAYQLFLFHVVEPGGTVHEMQLAMFRPDELGQAVTLVAGEYDLRVVGGGFSGHANEVVRITVASGEETRVELKPRPGCFCSVGVRVPDDAALPARVRLSLRDDAGRVFANTPSEPRERKYGFGIHLAAGLYHLDVTTSDGRTATFPFEVILPDDPDEEFEFVFPLR